MGFWAWTYWMATLPSTLPRANPVGSFFLSSKIETQRCWYFNGDSIFLNSCNRGSERTSSKPNIHMRSETFFALIHLISKASNSNHNQWTNSWPCLREWTKCNHGIFIHQFHLWLIFQMIDDNAPAGRATHSHRVFNVDAVASFGQLNLHHGIRLSSVPKFKSSIPAASHHAFVTWRFHVVNSFYWRWDQRIEKKRESMARKGEVVWRKW